MTTQVTKPKLIHAQVGVGKLTPTELLAQSTTVATNLDGSTIYTNLPVDIATIKATNASLSAAITASASGSKTAKADLAQQRADVAAMLRLLGHYVEVASNGDMTTFLSSGFTPVSTTKTPAQPLPPATIINVGPGNTGQFLVTILRIVGAHVYEIRYAAVGATGPGPWLTVLAASAKKAATVGGLTPGTSYILQVRAYNKAGYGDWSDSVTKLCT